MPSQVPPRSRPVGGAARPLAVLGREAPAQVTFRADFSAAAIGRKAAGGFAGNAAVKAAALYACATQLPGGAMARPKADRDDLIVPKDAPAGGPRDGGAPAEAGKAQQASAAQPVGSTVGFRPAQATRS